MAAMIAIQMAARPRNMQGILCEYCPPDPDVLLPPNVIDSSTDAPLDGARPTGAAPEESTKTDGASTEPEIRPQPFLKSLLQSGPFLSLFSYAQEDLKSETKKLYSEKDSLWDSLKDVAEWIFAPVIQALPSTIQHGYETPTRSESPAMSRCSSQMSLRSTDSVRRSLYTDAESDEDDEDLSGGLSAAQLSILLNAVDSGPTEEHQSAARTRLFRTLQKGFSSVDCLSLSFTQTPDADHSNEIHIFGLDVDELRQCYALLLQHPRLSIEIADAMVVALEILLAKLAVTIPSWRHGRKHDHLPFSTTPPPSALDYKLRIWIILLELPLLYSPEHADNLLRLCSLALCHAQRSVKNYFARHLAQAYAYETSFFEKLVSSLKEFILRRFNSSLSKADEGVVAAVRLLGVFYNANEMSSKFRSLPASQLFELPGKQCRTIIAYSSFYCTTPENQSTTYSPMNLNFKEELPRWRKSHSNSPNAKAIFSILNYPFLLDPIAKTRALRVESMIAMSSGFEQAFVHHAFVVQAQKLANGLQNIPHSSTSSRSMSRSTSQLQLTDRTFEARLEQEMPDVIELSSQRTLETADTSTSRINISNLESSFQTLTNPYLVLEVRRNYLVEDTLSQIQMKMADLQKPLKIRFVSSGEQGLDQGGVQTEFFQLIIQQLLDVNYGLCVYNTDTRLCWLNSHSLEKSHFYELTGLVLGLAVYNGVMVDLHFPELFYRKLLFDEDASKKGKDQLEEQLDDLLYDLSQLYPELHRGLLLLLNWDAVRDGGTVEDIFCRNFEISYETLGAVKTYPLLQNGESIAVTELNRKQYCALYAKHLLHDSVLKPFIALKKGFWKVVGKSVVKQGESSACLAIRLFRPEEFKLLLTGLSPSNPDEANHMYSGKAFMELKVNAKYDDYEPASTFIGSFWDIVLKEFDNEQRRKLLWFVTSSDRIPLGGLKEVTFIVQKNGNDDARLPTSMTCFGRLLLPMYSSHSILKERLSIAIEESQGFGLI